VEKKPFAHYVLAVETREMIDKNKCCKFCEKFQLELFARPDHSRYRMGRCAAVMQEPPKDNDGYGYYMNLQDATLFFNCDKFKKKSKRRIVAETLQGVWDSA
jgi:hypothetical protein